MFYSFEMDRASAIEQYRVSLLGHVMALFAMIGLTEGMTLQRIPKPLHRAVLLILRTAESAARRLIMGCGAQYRGGPAGASSVKAKAEGCQ